MQCFGIAGCIGYGYGVVALAVAIVHVEGIKVFVVYAHFPAQCQWAVVLFFERFEGFVAFVFDQRVGHIVMIYHIIKVHMVDLPMFVASIGGLAGVGRRMSNSVPRFKVSLPTGKTMLSVA